MLGGHSSRCTATPEHGQKSSGSARILNSKYVRLQPKFRRERGRKCRQNAVQLAKGGGLGAKVGGVGLSAFEHAVKHTFPQGFVRMVAEKIWSRGMEVKLRPPEDNRQLIIWEKIEIAEQRQNKLARAAESLSFIRSISSAIPIMLISLSPQL